MRIDWLRLENFRNYESFYAEFSPGVNVIFGNNAQGKTNLLEAASYLSAGKSFRARRERELVRFGSEIAELEAGADTGGRDCVLRARIFSTNARRQFYKNGVKLKTAAELSGNLSTVLFTPEDLGLIRDGAAARRKFMDNALCQLRPRYAAALYEYNRLHEHKTRILKDWREKPSLLDTLDDFSRRMAATGAIIIHYRARFAASLNSAAGITHSQCSGGAETLTLRYKTVSTIEEPMAAMEALYDAVLLHQERHRSAELEARACLTGPHKDDLEADINGASARQFGSQGQARTAALSLKLAEREIHREDSGAPPVLLLDDVLSELDPGRQEFVLSKIDGGQVFITCCDDDRLKSIQGGKVFTIFDGRLINN